MNNGWTCVVHRNNVENTVTCAIPEPAVKCVLACEFYVCHRVPLVSVSRGLTQRAIVVAAIGSEWVGSKVHCAGAM
jgi:hypothetical protein